MKLSEKIIYFGHQSVGYNILDGVLSILDETPGVKLDIVETTEVFTKGHLYHSRIGRNGDPVSKIEDFARIVEAGVGGTADIAFLKLCYVDFHRDTHVEDLFDTYRSTMVRLQDDYPGTRFVHVTAPLMARERGLKTLAKRALGRSLRGYEDNVLRERFNRMLREEYGSKGTFFDMARLESTLSDGTRLSFDKGGEVYYAWCRVIHRMGVT